MQNRALPSDFGTSTTGPPTRLLTVRSHPHPAFDELLLSLVDAEKDLLGKVVTKTEEITLCRCSAPPL